MKMMFAVTLAILVVWPWSSWFSASETISYSFDESELRDYIPICTNNITCDDLYGRIVKLGNQTAYEFFFYWDNQTGSYKFASHEYDWEFVVVYVYDNGTVSQVNYDMWHYYIGRTKDPAAYHDTNVLLYVNEDFHYFQVDRGIRAGNVSQQINNQTLNRLTEEIIATAEQQVGFDSKLFINPFDWKEKGFLGRYTAFNSGWKAFWVVADKQFDWIDLSNSEKRLTQWL